MIFSLTGGKLSLVKSYLFNLIQFCFCHIFPLALVALGLTRYEPKALIDKDMVVTKSF